MSLYILLEQQEIWIFNTTVMEDAVDEVGKYLLSNHPPMIDSKLINYERHIESPLLYSLFFIISPLKEQNDDTYRQYRNYQYIFLCYW